MNSILLKKAKVLVFDFDGTLVDSNAIKLGAFEKCFAEFSGHREAIMAYCRGHHHTPRREKFRHVVETILKRPYTPEAESALLDRYAAETTQKVIEAPEIPGALDFLRVWSAKRPAALLSSTPHEILLQILEKRNMGKYFTDVRGAPVRKADWLRVFARERGVAPEAVLFFGDTGEDARSAAEAGVAFAKVEGDFFNAIAG